MDAQTFADELIESLQFPVRQYAHLRSASQSSATGDHAETLYWHPLLVTDPSGKATIEFDLPDSETTFRVHIDGHTAQGRIGAASAEIVSRPR